MDENDISTKTNAKIVNTGPWLHAWFDPLAGKNASPLNQIQYQVLCAQTLFYLVYLLT
jgi:hypothetical protein